MPIFLALFLFLLADNVSAKSQEPSPAPTISSQQQDGHTTETNKNPADDPRGTDKQPFVIKSIEAEKTAERLNQERHERDEKSANERGLVIWTIVLALATVVLVLVAVGQLIMFWKQLGLMRMATEDAKTAADAAKANADAVMFAERAYIKISHTNLGLAFIDSTEEIFYGPERNFTVHVEVRNIGNTPARLTDVVVTPYIAPTELGLPPLPPYDVKPDRTSVHIIMYPDDMVSPPCTFPMSLADYEVIHDRPRTKQLYLLIYADYIDHFDIRHRAGYARHYDPDPREHSLVVVTQKGYNYDRPREKGEGNDWDEA